MSPLLILSLLGCVSPTNPIVALVFLGKNWHDNKRAFRPTAGLTSYAKRQELRKHQDAVKEREREMKQEKEAERQVSLLFNKFECLVFFFFLVSMFRFLAGGSFCFFFFWFPPGLSLGLSLSSPLPWKCGQTNTGPVFRPTSNASRTVALRRRRRLVMRRWRKRCTTSGSSGSSAARSATSFSTHELVLGDYVSFPAYTTPSFLIVDDLNHDQAIQHMPGLTVEAINV